MRRKTISQGIARNAARSATALLVGLFLATGVRAPAGTVDLERAWLRTPMPNEGYLEFKPDGFVAHGYRWGDEWTGWVDVRHPAMDGTKSAYYPYDRSDHRVDVHTIQVTDADGVGAGPNLPRDFDYGSKIYAQGGSSFVRVSSGAAATNVRWNAFDAAKRRELANSGVGRSSEDKLHLYYAKSFSDQTANGLTISPCNLNADYLKPYCYVRDGCNDSTTPHEAGHQLLNGHASEDNNDPTNFMYHTGSNYALTDIGVTKGIMTGPQVDRIYENAGANNPGFQKKPDGDHRFGHRVDWDFAAHDNDLESSATGADNHQGTDWLHWKIGHTETNPPPTHDHTGLDEFPPTPDFGGPTFRYADVFSLTLRYADFDAPAGGLYNSAGALDYWTYFEDASGALFPGEIVTIFDWGWTASTIVDNWLARWRSPVDAVGVYTLPRTDSGRDGNLQIDAVIVSAVPEPGGMALILAGVLLSRGRRR